MTGFAIATMTRKRDNSTPDITVTLYDNQIFSVAPTPPKAVPGEPLLPSGQPFSIVPGSCTPYFFNFFMQGKLQYDDSTVSSPDDWHAVFDRGRTILLEMSIDNRDPQDLTLCLECEAHSSFSVKRALKVAAHVALALVLLPFNFCGALLGKKDSNERRAEFEPGNSPSQRM